MNTEQLKRQGDFLMLDIESIRAFLAMVVAHYEKSAPTVSRWGNDLYVRIEETPEKVSLIELIATQRLYEEGQWAMPQYAANNIYKLMDSLGQDTIGHAGF